MKALIAIYEKEGKQFVHPDFYKASEYIIYDPTTKVKESLGEDRDSILDYGFLNLLEEKEVECILTFNLRMSAMVVLRKKGIRVLKPSAPELEKTLSDYSDGTLNELAEDELTAFKGCPSSCDSCSTGTCS